MERLQPQLLVFFRQKTKVWYKTSSYDNHIDCKLTLASYDLLITGNWRLLEPETVSWSKYLSNSTYLACFEKVFWPRVGAIYKK